jgi:hypothetical protein
MHIRPADLPLFQKVANGNLEPEKYSTKIPDIITFEDASGGAENEEFDDFVNERLTFLVYDSGCPGVWMPCIRASWFGDDLTRITTDFDEFFVTVDKDGNPNQKEIEDLKIFLKIYNKVMSYISNDFYSDKKLKAEIAKQVILGNARA